MAATACRQPEGTPTFQVDVHAWPVMGVTQQPILLSDEPDQGSSAQALVTHPVHVHTQTAKRERPSYSQRAQHTVCLASKA
jgi:hypothetical protein